MKNLLSMLCLGLLGCVSAPERVSDHYREELAAAQTCVQTVLRRDVPVVDPWVAHVDDGFCVNGLPYIELAPDRTPELGCYFVGKYDRVYLEEDAVWHEVSRVISHELTHLLLDRMGVPVADHHFVTGTCNLNGGQQ